MKNVSGMSAVVSSQNVLRTVRARSTTAPVRRFANPVFCTAPPKTKAPIISQITSEASASKSFSCGEAPTTTSTSTAARAT
jgi:hypothetical protein